jgi:large subunit ribosomal protein L31
VYVWSGNRLFHLGNCSALLIDDDQVEKFRKRYGDISQIMDIPVLNGEIVLPPKRKAILVKGGRERGKG